MSKFLTVLSSFFHKKKDDTALVSEKDKIRAEIRLKKRQMTPEQTLAEAAIVFQKIETLPEFIEAKAVLMYWSLADEFPTHDFIEKWYTTKTILLPVVHEGNLVIRKFTGKENLIKGKLGIPEPNENGQISEEFEIVITPGMAFDFKKRRLGRGKGYYDRFLRHRNVQKWGVGFDFQVLDNIPVASFDVTMDKILTASHTI